MARKGKSVYERIEEVKSEIQLTEQHLSELKTQLQSLYDEKDDLEMRQTWAAIKSNGLNLEDIQKILTKQSKAISKTA